jgi:regulator of replication initiation timing
LQDEHKKLIASLEDRVEGLQNQNIEFVSQNHMLQLKNEALTQKILSLRHKKVFYKNQVVKQNDIIRDQLSQVKLMQSEQMSFMTKIES